ncbi:transposable element Tcb2 transposase [Trichonephila clavipes]|nr:transposable element Tcb2 transposase [Trichonephila clavipes]
MNGDEYSFTDESRFSLSSDSHRIPSGESGEAAIIPRTSLKGTGAMGLQFLFMEDNAPCHRTVAAEQLFESEDIERMDWLGHVLRISIPSSVYGIFYADTWQLVPYQQNSYPGGSVVVVHEEPHPEMTGALSYRPEETGGRQREKSLDARQATGRPISRFTVARRLHGGGLFARRPVRCTPLTPAHRRRRSLWCREHRNWRDNEWGRVLTTDESRFSLSSDSHRIPSGESGEAAIIPRTSLKGTGSVNETRYCNEILLPYVRLFRGAMGLQFLFMEDNAPCHRTVAAEQLLESEDIERMDWPARSPDLNPIERVWNFLRRHLAARTLPAVMIRELRLALQGEWAAMPQQLIDTLILSMGRRCETYLAIRGDHIPY